MTDQPHIDDSQPGLAKGQTPDSKGTDITTPPPPVMRVENPAAAHDPAPEKNLSAEEQLALYEKDLKENDWGHQPC